MSTIRGSFVTGPDDPDSRMWPEPTPPGFTEPAPGSVGPISPNPPSGPPPGALKIKQRRSWKTWQLVVVAVIALLAGMALSANGSSSPAASARTYTPPPPAGSPETSAPTTTLGATPTTAASTASSAPASAAPDGTVQVLVPRTQSQGNWTSSAFTISGGQWFIGWAFQCTPAPASGPGFTVYVVPAGQQPSGPAAVTIGGANGESVTQETSTGAQQIVLQTQPGCTWVVKVTGNGSP